MAPSSSGGSQWQRSALRLPKSALPSGSSGRDDGNGNLAVSVAGFGTAQVTMRCHTDVAHDEGSGHADLVKNAEPGSGQSNWLGKRTHAKIAAYAQTSTKRRTCKELDIW